MLVCKVTRSISLANATRCALSLNVGTQRYTATLAKSSASSPSYRNLHAMADIDMSAVMPDCSPKPLSALPGPPTLPILGNFLTYIKPSNIGRLHEVMDEYHQQYGPVFMDKLGVVTQVHVNDPELVAKIFRAQGHYPDRPPIQAWREWRHHNDQNLGILTSEGEQWHKIRRILGQRMLKPSMGMGYADDFNNVIDDTTSRLKMLRDTKGHLQLAQDLPNELYKWAFESIGTVLFETRLGCLDNNMPPMTQDFINSIAKMMSTSLQVIIGEKIHRRLNTPFWQNHAEAWNTLFSITKQFVDRRLTELEPLLAGRQTTEEQKGEFLTYLLSSKQMSMKEIYSNVMEVMLAGVDTTSNTLCFALHLLAQNPEVQARLHEEVTMVTGGATPSAEHVKNMPYLKYIIKETLRLYPVITMNVRISQEDVNLKGYNLPKGTIFIMNHYSASRDERNFERPLDFIPERWDRECETTKHPFASLPFGFGTRSCIGRRLAELELYLALSRFSQNFKVEPLEGVELRPQLRTVLTPGNCVPVKFIDRHEQ